MRSGHARVCRATRRPPPAGPGVQWGGAPGGGRGRVMELAARVTPTGSSGRGCGQRGFLGNPLCRGLAGHSAQPHPCLHSWHPQPPFPRGSRSDRAPCLDLLLRGRKAGCHVPQVLPGRTVTESQSQDVLGLRPPEVVIRGWGPAARGASGGAGPGLGAGEGTGAGCHSAPPLSCAVPAPAPPCLPRVSRLASGTAPLHAPPPGTHRRVGSARRPGPSGPHTAFPLWVTQMPTRRVWRHRKGQTGRGAPGGHPAQKRHSIQVSPRLSHPDGLQ